MSDTIRPDATSSARASLKLKNDMGEIARLAEEIGAFCEQNGVSPDSLFAVNLALEEVVTNVFEHGFENGDHEIDVEVWLGDGSVHATVADDGREYDPLQREDPDVDAPIDERQVGGLGVMLVKRLMDDVAYARTGGRNVLSMRKRA